MPVFCLVLMGSTPKKGDESFSIRIDAERCLHEIHPAALQLGNNALHASTSYVLPDIILVKVNPLTY